MLDLIALKNWDYQLDKIKVFGINTSNTNITYLTLLSKYYKYAVEAEKTTEAESIKSLFYTLINKCPELCK